jgi:hypothetical protein
MNNSSSLQIVPFQSKSGYAYKCAQYRLILIILAATSRTSLLMRHIAHQLQHWSFLLHMFRNKNIQVCLRTPVELFYEHPILNVYWDAQSESLVIIDVRIDNVNNRTHTHRLAGIH